MLPNAPLYRLLKDDDIELIDRMARRILGEIGMKITGSPERSLLERIEAAGAEVDFEDPRISFNGERLDEILGHAPSRFILYSRDGRNDLHLGEGKVHFGNGGRVFRILDMGTGGYRKTLLRDVANTSTLVQYLDNISFYIIACQAHDIKPKNYHLLDFSSALNHTTKHVMGGCTDLHGAGQLWKLVSIVAGGEDQFRRKPFVSVITNPISPLTIDAVTLDILDFCTARGIPTTCAPAPISGATAPATLAGTLAQMHAESLAGAAVTQALFPGARALYGAVPMTMDLRTMELAMGSVEMTMMNTCAPQLAKCYNLPIYASGGLTESKRPDIQAGIEEGFSNLLVALAGADYIHLAAGMLDSGNSISYEQFVIDNEIIGMIRRVLEGITVNEDTLALDVLQGVGPGGNFIAEDHTVEHMLDEFFYPDLGVRYNFDIWEEKGRPDMLSRAHELVEKILDENKEGLLDLESILELKVGFSK